MLDVDLEHRDIVSMLLNGVVVAIVQHASLDRFHHGVDTFVGVVLL